jgi:hypothetical protein
MTSSKNSNSNIINDLSDLDYDQDIKSPGKNEDETQFSSSLAVAGVNHHRGQSEGWVGDPKKNPDKASDKPIVTDESKTEDNKNNNKVGNEGRDSSSGEGNPDNPHVTKR